MIATLLDNLLTFFDLRGFLLVAIIFVPLERLLGSLLDAGYAGAIDLEILGPRIEKEGYASAIRRSLDRAGEILAHLGA